MVLRPVPSQAVDGHVSNVSGLPYWWSFVRSVFSIDCKCESLRFHFCPSRFALRDQNTPLINGKEWCITKISLFHPLCLKAKCATVLCHPAWSLSSLGRSTLDALLRRFHTLRKIFRTLHPKGPLQSWEVNLKCRLPRRVFEIVACAVCQVEVFALWPANSVGLQLTKDKRLYSLIQSCLCFSLWGYANLQNSLDRMRSFPLAWERARYMKTVKGKSVDGQDKAMYSWFNVHDAPNKWNQGHSAINDPW